MKRYVAPMPPSLRHQMRAGSHPARAVECPHCAAKPHHSCVLRKSGRELADPHPMRIDAWARTVACCPACQVEPGIPREDAAQIAARKEASTAHLGQLTAEERAELEQFQRRLTEGPTP